MTTSLLLDLDTWDLCLDANGNVAVASEPYAQAQDAACAIRTFLGECWYDTTDGVAYLEIFGKFPDAAFIKAQIEAAALTAPGVQAAVFTFTSYSAETRELQGACLLTLAGATATLAVTGDSSGFTVSIGA